jgi:hypothetical protein
VTEHGRRGAFRAGVGTVQANVVADPYGTRADEEPAAMSKKKSNGKSHHHDVTLVATPSGLPEGSGATSKVLSKIEYLAELETR